MGRRGLRSVEGRDVAGIGRDIVRVVLGDMLLATLLAVGVHTLATMGTAVYDNAWRDRVRQVVREHVGTSAPWPNRDPAPWPEPADGTYAD